MFLLDTGYCFNCNTLTLLPINCTGKTHLRVWSRKRTKRKCQDHCLQTKQVTNSFQFTLWNQSIILCFSVFDYTSEFRLMSTCSTTFKFQEELNTLYLPRDPPFSFKSKRYPQKKKVWETLHSARNWGFRVLK